MSRKMYLVEGNICGDQVRVARALHKPPLTQEELAQKIQFLGYSDITKVIVSRIEKGQRHVCDAELCILAKALNVSVEWLVSDFDQLNNTKKE